MKRISSGLYKYKGYLIRNHGYYKPDKCIWWEAINEITNEADYHEHTLKEIKTQIDKSLLNDKPKIKNFLTNIKISGT